ncbi:MAG TPA: beta-N-acetylhexosaminidase [Bryocella sp.]|nr:beta-N-acetylhexosaminidase [Bryocella sp.]
MSPKRKHEELRGQVGQLLVMGFDGTMLSQRLRLMLETFQPGGIILFQRNLEDAEQAHTLLSEAQKASATPMFLCVDMEGGTVDRLRDVIAPIPSVAEVAASRSKKLCRKHGRLIGEELRALGFNTDFAPVLDLKLEASQLVLGSRTVAAKPKQVIAYAHAFLRGLRDCDILGCGKHFPGLGEASLDTHAELPAIDKPWKRLWKEDLAPYRELRRELPFVMVAHTAYPQVTSDSRPASLSKPWMSGILRKKIGYRGLIITDDLDMGGVLAAAPVEEAAVETLLAGADMFLICQKEESVRRAFEAVLQRAEKDNKFARLVAEKSVRVLAAKKRSKGLRRMPEAPSQKKVERLTRRFWEFGEELRAHALRDGVGS